MRPASRFPFVLMTVFVLLAASPARALSPDIVNLRNDFIELFNRGTSPVNVAGTIAMSATTGKVALVNTATLLTGSGCPFAASVVDFIGYGTASCSEGTAAPTLTNTTADLRAAGGCTDTDVNSSDFSSGAPVPRNSSPPLNAGASSPVTFRARVESDSGLFRPLLAEL